jgi:hypothetical protein
LAGIIPTRRQRKPSFFQEFSHLGFTTLDARQVSDLTLRFLNRRRRMLAEVGFQGNDMPVQRTARLMPREFFEFLDAAFVIQPQIVAQRVLGHADQLRDLGVRQAMAFQPQRFHAPLHQRHRMMIPFVV